MANMSITALRGDPVLNHNFIIQLLDSSGAAPSFGAAAEVLGAIVGGFSECTGIEMTMKIEEFSEGGRNGEVLRFPGRTSWTNITLKKGIAAGTALWDWHYSFVEGRGRRRDGVIMLLNEMRAPSAIWQFTRGLPAKYTGPSLSATQNNVAIESIEIAHEGIVQVPGIGIGAAAAGAVTSLLG
jgi:phage tail-like protein